MFEEINEDVKHLQLEFFRHALISAHDNTKIKKFQIWSERNQIYSIGDDRRISITDINKKERVYELKIANLSFKSLEIHPELEKLYISMKEGILLIYDVSEVVPTILHTIKPSY